MSMANIFKQNRLPCTLELNTWTLSLIFDHYGIGIEFPKTPSSFLTADCLLEDKQKASLEELIQAHFSLVYLDILLYFASLLHSFSVILAQFSAFRHFRHLSFRIMHLHCFSLFLFYFRCFYSLEIGAKYGADKKEQRRLESDEKLKIKTGSIDPIQDRSIPSRTDRAHEDRSFIFGN